MYGSGGYTTSPYILIGWVVCSGIHGTWKISVHAEPKHKQNTSTKPATWEVKVHKQR